MSITKLSPNWACQMGPIHCPKFLLPGDGPEYNSNIFGTVARLQSTSIVIVNSIFYRALKSELVGTSLFTGVWAVWPRQSNMQRQSDGYNYYVDGSLELRRRG